MTAPMLAAHGLRKTYGRTEALRGVSLEVGAGETLAITGPSGSGKSTLLLALAGVVKPEGGSVCYDGATLGDLSESDRTRLRRRHFGLVLQFGGLVPELTATQNVSLPLLLDGHRRAAAEAHARSWLERVGAADVADAQPGEMSGGEAQRVAVARALVAGPRIVFADEPTGALDTVSGEELMRTLRGAADETGASVVLVTHDNRLAATADREIVLKDGCVDGSDAA
jgi:putative ABC transport system ATP-binding protein